MRPKSPTRRHLTTLIAAAAFAPACAPMAQLRRRPRAPDLAALVAHGGEAPDPSLMGAGLLVCSGADLVEHAYAAGSARLSGAAMSVDAPLRIASVSKFVCALAAMRLAETGVLDLDADAGPLVGFRLRNPAFPDRSISLRALLSHTSSLRDGDKYWADFPDPLESLFGGVDATQRWGAEPPGFFTYCNLNYGLVAQAMEKATRERFDLLMRRLVFAPLGLDCGYNWSGVSVARRAAGATLYRRTGPDGETPDPKGRWTPQVDEAPEGSAAPVYRARTNAPPVTTYAIGSNGSLFSPQGGLRLSVRDLARIGVDVLRGLSGRSAIFSPAALAPLINPVWRTNGRNGDEENGLYRAYGAGAHLLDKQVFGHFGEAYGLRSALLIDPERRAVCAYAINGFASPPSAGVARAERALIDSAGFAHAFA